MKQNSIKNLIFVFVLLIISIIIFFLLFKQIDKYQNSFKSINIDFRNQEKRNAEIQSLNKIISEIGGEISSLDSHFLEATDIAPFLDDLQNKAKEIGVNTEVVSVENPNKENQSIILGLRAEGTFDAIYKFLLLIENSKYELEVNEISLTRTLNEPDINSLPMWDADFEIKIISFIAN